MTGIENGGKIETLTLLQCVTRLLIVECYIQIYANGLQVFDHEIYIFFPTHNWNGKNIYFALVSSNFKEEEL